ncbi:MAG: cation transporter [Armatimonadia bacterium]
MSLQRRARNLSIFTVAYNIAEGAVSMLLGTLAGSAALIGFGLDSFVESLSGSIMIWRFTRHDLTEEQEERIEDRAVRLVGWTFLALGAYVLYESGEKLIRHEAPEASIPGLALALLSLIAMPWLARAKRRTGEALGSPSLVGDSKETLACAWLSVALLFGLGLNAAFGLWWADPVAGLIIVVFLVREGLEMVRGGCECCDCHTSGKPDAEPPVD